MTEQPKILFLAKTGSISRKDILRAERLCGICIIECSEPESARYSEPPISADIDGQARAALSLMRIIIERQIGTNFSRETLISWFTSQLINAKRPEEVNRFPKVKS